MLPGLAQGSVVKGDGTGLPAGRVAGEAWCGSHNGHCQGHGWGRQGHLSGSGGRSHRQIQEGDGPGSIGFTLSEILQSSSWK